MNTKNYKTESDFLISLTSQLLGNCFGQHSLLQCQRLARKTEAIPGIPNSKDFNTEN